MLTDEQEKSIVREKLRQQGCDCNPALTLVRNRGVFAVMVEYSHGDRCAVFGEWNATITETTVSDAIPEWRHVGGGYTLVGYKELPCDDDYEEDGTGRRVRFNSTPETHFDLLPPVILNMDEFVRAIAGRKDIRVDIAVVREPLPDISEGNAHEVRPQGLPTGGSSGCAGGGCESGKEES